MCQNYVMKSISEIEQLAKKMGLDFYQTYFEFVDKDIMLEACTYGLPRRSRHWSYGRSYQQQKIYGEMGLSKVYEVVFNNDPAYAFLLNTNSDIINIMVGAHVFGHCDFFKNNVMFKGTDSKMVYRAAERATRVDSYIDQYGLEKVEHIMDIGFALDNHIDWHKGIFRKKFDTRRVVETVRKSNEFDDIFRIDKGNRKVRERKINRKTIGGKIPPKPERDLLWFLINYSKLEDWESDILSIIREESYYFYPIVQTKILNEGWACVSKDSLVYTDNGIMEFEDLVNRKEKAVFDGSNKQKVYDYNIIQDKEMFRIRTKRGLELSGSDNHRIMLKDGTWKELSKLGVGDKVVVSGGNNMWGKEYKSINFVPYNKEESLKSVCKKLGVPYSTYYRNNRGLENVESADAGIKGKLVSKFANRKEIKIPKILDERLASFLGYITGDGHVSDAARCVGLTSGDDYCVNHFSDLCMDLFGVNCSRKWDYSSKNGRWRVNTYSKTLINFLTDEFGFATGVSAKIKRIPKQVLMSPKPVVASFLRSYFDCDACASEKNGIILVTSSDSLAKQTQVVLMNFGVLSSRSKSMDGCWRLTITGSSAKDFYDQIGFGLERKQNKLKKYINNRRWFCKEEWVDEIKSVEGIGKGEVYDISVEDTHRYAASGLVNHNSFWHAELMNEYTGINEEEFIDFAKTHSGVINPGNPFNINPYYLGFKILNDIRRRWDELYKNGKSDINGMQKLFQVAAEEDDASFLRNYLTKDLVADIGLFNYGYKNKRKHNEKQEELTEEDGIIELKDRDIDKIIENILRPTMNYGVPLITVDNVDGDVLEMTHGDGVGPLDQKYASKVMEYIYEIWGGPVELWTYDFENNQVMYVFDEGGFETTEKQNK